MNWYDVVGLISSIALFAPIIIILLLRLAWYKSFPALLVYYLLVSCQTFLALNFMNVSKSFVQIWGITNNFLDAPLMLTFMTYFSKIASFRKKMKIVIAALIIFEVIVIAIYGYGKEALPVVLGPGVLLVFGFSIIFFFHQAKITIVYQKAAGKALMAASLLFAYGGYFFIYIVYYLLKTPYKADAFLIYYCVATFSSLIFSAGLFYERKRVKQLTELKIARQELKVIYGQ
ncbi:MAG TPA: hypothetical protein VI461_05000 [Chitinophagaceae bacterium]|nr:hypothetical protein [Chitinophagaceae bacterium]